MNKRELANAIAEKTGLTIKDSEDAVIAFMDSVTEALTNGEKVQLLSFGTFEVKERKARIGRDPRTNKEIAIPASKAVAFKVSKQLKLNMNK